MEKKLALILAFLITSLLFVNISFFKSPPVLERESAVISRVIDGDTLELEDSRKVRLLNINSPEKKAPGYTLSLNYLKSFENREVELEMLGADKYNRLLARIYAPDYLNLELVKEGLASKFLVDKSELRLFAEAEESAINNRKGIWEKSIYFSCITSDIDAKNEKVILINKCGKVNISSWFMKDESSKTYVFKEMQFEEITIYSHKGNNTHKQLFWNSKTNIWNNDRDTLYLFDKDGKIIHSKSYGY